MVEIDDSVLLFEDFEDIVRLRPIIEGADSKSEPYPDTLRASFGNPANATMSSKPQSAEHCRQFPPSALLVQ